MVERNIGIAELEMLPHRPAELGRHQWFKHHDEYTTKMYKMDEYRY
jgi:hypothetical protein